MNGLETRGAMHVDERGDAVNGHSRRVRREPRRLRLIEVYGG